MLDYLIVGLGLAGISFCEQLEEKHKTFRVFSDNSQQASLVAGGLYNPVILKRFTMAWNAKEQLEQAMPFYQNLERKLNLQLDFKLSVLRRFASVEEQNGWFEAADKPSLKFFLAPEIIHNKNPNLDSPFGYGKVRYTGRIDTKALLKTYVSYLKKRELLMHETFNHNSLQVFEDKVIYKGITAKQIVFAEGFGLKNNLFFNYLPLNGTKGELITIKAPSLNEENVIKSSVFIIPLGDDLYRIGATYKWKDKTNAPTEGSKIELLEKLNTFLKCDFEIVQHVAGVRPTVPDRRPLVGSHPKHKNMFVLNGFGSRGVMIAPYASKQLFQHIEREEKLNKEMDISRFTKKYYTDLIH